MSNFTLIYYIVPEDYDEQEQPNAFGISKSIDEIKLKDVRDHFPLEGTYHFRFKYQYHKAVVWMDLNNDDCKVPTFQDRVICKVTRINWAAQTNGKPSSEFNIFEAEASKQDFDLLFPH